MWLGGQYPSILFLKHPGLALLLRYVFICFSPLICSLWAILPFGQLTASGGLGRQRRCMQASEFCFCKQRTKEEKERERETSTGGDLGLTHNPLSSSALLFTVDYVVDSEKWSGRGQERRPMGKAAGGTYTSGRALLQQWNKSIFEQC